MAKRTSAAGNSANPVLAELWRAEMLESVHRGTAVVAAPSGEIVAAWGDPARVVLPRSAAKMIQALPLVESGAADAAGLGPEQLALACASHRGAPVHTRLAARWLESIGLGEPDLRCGAHPPGDLDTRCALHARGEAPSQLHNNCSGKHCGFLTLGRRLGGGPEYIDPSHPAQQAVRRVTEELTGERVAGFAIDGCSAPNFAVTLAGLAAAMARLATAGRSLGGARGRAAQRLVEAVAAHPVLVAGEGHACTGLIRACAGRAVVKTGAEGVFVALLPARGAGAGGGLGIALKVDDGASRASEAAMAALLARYGALERGHPVFAALADAPLRNWRGIVHGQLRAAPALMA
ncbi:MAG TPA: asparaginase [Thermohalobaculum sp.]|nr:asparaginase [Thermohalobaculum sp.]